MQEDCERRQDDDLLKTLFKSSLTKTYQNQLNDTLCVDHLAIEKLRSVGLGELDFELIKRLTGKRATIKTAVRET
jgi:hypothetical protein